MTKPLHLYGPFPQSIKGAAQIFDYSRMVGRFFGPDEKICLIFHCETYDTLREEPQFAQRHNIAGFYDNEFEYYDMPRAKEQADEFEEGIKAYGFSEEQIRRYKDVDHNTMSEEIFLASLQMTEN